MNEYRKKKIKVSTERKNELMNEIDCHIQKKIMTKYNIMKIRSKISYSAYIKKTTIQELILKQIIKTYTHFHGVPRDQMDP